MNGLAIDLSQYDDWQAAAHGMSGDAATKEEEMSKTNLAYDTEHLAPIIRQLEQRIASLQAALNEMNERQRVEWGRAETAEAERDAIHNSIRTCTVCLRGWISDSGRCPFCEGDEAYRDAAALAQALKSFDGAFVSQLPRLVDEAQSIFEAYGAKYAPAKVPQP